MSDSTAGLPVLVVFPPPASHLPTAAQVRNHSAVLQPRSTPPHPTEPRFRLLSLKNGTKLWTLLTPVFTVALAAALQSRPLGSLNRVTALAPPARLAQCSALTQQPGVPGKLESEYATLLPKTLQCLPTSCRLGIDKAMGPPAEAPVSRNSPGLVLPPGLCICCSISGSQWILPRPSGST